MGVQMVAIFVVLMIVTFLVVDMVYQRVQARKAVAAFQNVYKAHGINPISAISVPDGLFFHPGHSWASILQDGSVRVGLDDFTNKLVGKIDSIEVKNFGGAVKQGDPLIVLRQGSRTAEIVAPVDGTVEMINEMAANNPETIRHSPYESGWVCAVKPTNLVENLKKLNIAETAKQWARNEVDRLQEFFTGSSFENRLVGQTLQDGGAPVEGVLRYMSDEAWGKFQDEFLSEGVEGQG